MPEHVSMLQPHMGQINGRPILMVDGKPFIMLAGEVHNSSSSSLTYMERVWEKADALGMNCLLLPVTWELTEPEEGRFDFSLVRGLIEQARRYGKKDQLSLVRCVEKCPMLLCAGVGQNGPGAVPSGAGG